MTVPGLLPRLLEGPLAKSLRSSPVVVVTGARQTGKSTLARMLGEASARSYVTLADGILSVPWWRVI